MCKSVCLQYDDATMFSSYLYLFGQGAITDWMQSTKLFSLKVVKEFTTFHCSKYEIKYWKESSCLCYKKALILVRKLQYLITDDG